MNEKSKALFEAIAIGNVDAVIFLLINNRDLLGLRDNDDDTILHKATQFNQLKVLDLLTHFGLSINVTGCSCRTPLMVSVVEGSWSCFDLLTSKKANLEARDTLNETILHKMASVGAVEAFNLLKQRYPMSRIEALLNLKNIVGSTPLMNASHNGHYNMVMALLMFGSKVDLFLTDDFGFTAFDMATTKGHHQVAQLLKLAMEQAQMQRQQMV